MTYDVFIEIALFVLLLGAAYTFVVTGPKTGWWPFLPYKTPYITAYREWLKRLR